MLGRCDLVVFARDEKKSLVFLNSITRYIVIFSSTESGRLYFLPWMTGGEQLAEKKMCFGYVRLSISWWFRRFSCRRTTRPIWSFSALVSAVHANTHH